MRGRGLAVVVLLAVGGLATGTAPAGGQEVETTTAIGVEEYRSGLEAIAVALERDDLPDAHRRARALQGTTVVTGEGEPFEADPTTLGPVARAQDAAEAVRARARVRRVVESLGPPLGLADPDASLLERLAREEAARRPRPGGEVDTSVPIRAPTLPERLEGWLLAVVDWLGDVLARLWRWLLRFAPRVERGEPARTAGLVTLLVAFVVLVLGVAAVWALRRRADPVAAAEPGEEASARDEDPLSREASEWERYAADLARAGHRREAIRAWYHAVLVALFRSGRLHHQRGRTNWEYVAAVGPEAAWRPAFADLTRSFDREWYGREASAPEALRECAERAREVLRAVRGEAAA